jgi:sulfite exporter TauE/SafE
MIWTAFLLGFAGSLHCAAMCGPLALALPGRSRNRASFIVGRGAYNLGRLSTYVLLGTLFGWIGKSLALIGTQRWVSAGAGVVLLVGVVSSSRRRFESPFRFIGGQVKQLLSRFLRSNSTGSLYLLGLANGFLPCGLVYAACVGAATLNNPLQGSLYLLVFGLGTFPMMLAISLTGASLPFALRLRLQRWSPVMVGLVSSLLIVRGLALGIPYLSPAVSGVCPLCH